MLFAMQDARTSGSINGFRVKVAAAVLKFMLRNVRSAKREMADTGTDEPNERFTRCTQTKMKS
jgi:hypothetical protein